MLCSGSGVEDHVSPCMFIFECALHLLQILLREGRGAKGFLFFGCVNVCVFIKMKKSINKLWGKIKK